MTRPVSIAVTTPTRFHHFDLARELDRRGCLSAIHTGFPRRLLRASGVDPLRIRPFPWLQTPWSAANRLDLLPMRPREWWRRLAWTALDDHIARRSSDCDVYVAHTGAGLAAGRAIQARGGVYVCDAGTTHVTIHARLLREEYQRLGLVPPDFEPGLVERELAEYEAADAITVPSKFVLDSFVEAGVARTKLHLLPYGVDLDVFRRVRPRDSEFRVLFVGALSAQKGLHHLLDAFAAAHIPTSRLVLVGPVEPETPVLRGRTQVRDIELTGPISRAEVVEEMSRASVLVLPSVHDGFGLVIAEALACGCPVIASNHSGGPELIDDGKEGFIVPVGDVDALANRLRVLAANRVVLEQMSFAAVDRVHRIGGWRGYGSAALAVYVQLARAKGIEVTAPPDVATVDAPVTRCLNVA